MSRSRSRSLSLASLQALFAQVLPRIEACGRVYFRHVRCADTRENAVCEVVALSWKWCLRLVEKGKDPISFISAIATLAARAVKSGRRLCGQEKARDGLSPVAQQRKGFAVCKLPDYSTLCGNPLTDALIDNTKTLPDLQAMFRIDFPAWLASLDESRRLVAEDLMMGERTMDVADRHRMSPARISQLRRELMEEWNRLGEAEQ